MSTTPPPTDPSPPPVKRLTRSKDDRVLAGVCGGAAQYFGFDPVIARIVAVVLVFFGGAGVLLYLAAVLLVPNEGEAGALTGTERNRWLMVAGVFALLVVIGPFVLAPAFIVGGLLFPVAFLIIAGLVAAWFATGRWPEREAGPIAKATALGLGVLAVLFLVSVGAFWGAGAGGEEVVAGLVIAAGAALVAGAFLKPVRWLIPLALALAIPAGFVSAAGIQLDGGAGEKRYTPQSSGEMRDRYELGVGKLIVDLRGADLEPDRDHRVGLQVGMGHALLLVDDDVCVAMRGEVGAGQADLFTLGNDGLDVDVDEMPVARAGSPRVIVDGEVGLGLLEVDIVEGDHRDSRDGPGWQRGGERLDLSDDGNNGCVGA